jgi:hypothetical protein
MSINRDFEINYIVNEKTLKGSVFFEVKEQYKVQMRYFLPHLFFDYSERLSEIDTATDYQASDTPYFLSNTDKSMQLTWIYPKKKYQISIYIEKDVCIRAIYKATLDFYEMYKDHASFQKDMQRLFEAIKKLESKYSNILNED